VLPDFFEVFGLERGPLSLVSTIEELLEKKKSSGSGLEIQEYSRRDPLRRPRDIPLSAEKKKKEKKLGLNSPTSGGRSVGIVFLAD
jgi:hypothetical protein